MESRIRHIFLPLLAVILMTAGETFAQEHKERRYIRSGNKSYEALEYGEAESKYREAIVKNETSFEAGFNLGDALYKQERFEEAENILQALSKHPLLTPEQKAKLHYNLGNSQFQQQKLKEALESYKQSLLNNPADLEAKHNLAYVQKLLEEENQDGGGGNNNDPQDDPEQSENENDDSGNQEESKGDPDQDNQDQNDEGDEQGDRNERPKPEPQERPEAAISQEDAEQMLEAIQRQEDRTREKLDEKRKAESAPSGKNW